MKRKPYNNIDIVITGNVAWCDELTWDERIFYGVVRGLTRNDYYCCYASNKRLAEQMGKSERTIRAFMKKLEDAGFVLRDYAYIQYDNKICRLRAIVPKDLERQFLKQREIMIDAKTASKIITPMGGEKLPPTSGEKLPPNILNKRPYRKNSTSTNIEVETNPQTPLQGGNRKDTLVEPEQFELFGKEQNVRLTKSQRATLSEEFGADLAQSLIEQFSAWIKSGVKRLRKKVDHYALLRDWGLRRTQPKQATATRVLIGGRDTNRSEYSQAQLDALFADLGVIDDADDG